MSASVRVRRRGLWMSGKQATAGAGDARLAWVDAARGLGIILVVYGHALRGQITARLYPASALTVWQDQLIYAFHMPLFFFLSGLFAGVGTRTEGFVARRFRTLAWPYLLWSLIQGLMSIAGSRYANTPVSPDALWRIGWQPIGQFWFLYALLLCNLLLLLPRMLFFASVPLIVAASLLNPWVTIATLAAGDLPYFALGVLIGAPRLSDWLAECRTAPALVLCGWGTFAALFVWDNGLPSLLLGWLRAFAGIAGTIGVAALVGRHWRWLVGLGVASMPIYLMHVIAQAGFRALLRHFALPPDVMLAGVFLFALLAPVAAWLLLSRLRLSAPLGLGKPASRQARTPEAPDGLGIGAIRT